MSILKYILCFGSLFCCSIFYSQSTFYKVYSGLGYDVGEGIAELPDSSFVVTGSSTSWEGSSQVYFMKIDSAGARQWTKHYGGPESDGASRVLFNADLGLYAVGYTNSIGLGDYNGMVVKTDDNGNEEWQKSFGEPDAWEFLNDAVFGRDSSIIMVGNSQSLIDGDQDVYMLRITADGDTLWTKKIANQGSDYATSIVRIQDSLFIVGGAFYCEDSLSQKGFLMKINEAGQLLWKDTLGNYSGDYTIEDVSVSTDKINAVGARIVSDTNHDSYLLKLDFDGAILLEETQNDPNAESDVIMDEIAFVQNLNKNVLGFRVVNSFTLQDNYDANVAYFNEPSLLWLNNFTSINYLGLDEVNDLLPTSDGGFIGVGQTTYPLSGGSNIFVLKAGPTGSLPYTGEYYTIDTLVQLNEKEQVTQIHVHPNPSLGNIVFDYEGGAQLELCVYNNHGGLVYTNQIKSGEIQDLSFIPRGFYYAELSGEVFKLIRL